MKKRSIPGLILFSAGLAAGAAHAALPALTPAQQQAAADKKAKDAAQADKDKAALAASMEAVSAHYRQRAAAQGWKTHPPVAVAAAAPGGLSAPVTGNPAAGASAPIRSEKLGTAPPSTDVKAAPTPTLPAGTPPAVVKKGTPKVKNK